jgi:hypothetical protein
MKKNVTSVMFGVFVSLVFCLTGCGGGSGSTPIATTPVASTETYQLKTALANQASNSRSLPYTISGTSSGTSVSGSGTITQSSLMNATFEGETVLQKVTTDTVSLVVNGVTSPMASTSTNYMDSNYIPKGSSSTNEYDVVTGSVNIPATIRVNDTGIMYTTNRYTDSTKKSSLGTYVTSFVLQPDSASTALLKIISTQQNTSGVVTSIRTDNYRMTPAGALTHISKSGVGDTISITFTY